MNREEFLSKLQFVLETDALINSNSVFAQIPEWDSLALLKLSALANSEFGIILNLNEIKNFVTVEDLLKRLGI